MESYRHGFHIDDAPPHGQINWGNEICRAAKDTDLEGQAQRQTFQIQIVVGSMAQRFEIDEEHCPLKSYFLGSMGGGIAEHGNQ